MRPLLLLALFLTFLLALASPADAERRALLIGIFDYQHIQKLDNPPVDIALIGGKLAAAGYQITKITGPDTTRAKLLAAIGAFLKTIKQGDEIVVYYSGHGVDIAGDNLIVPADSPGVADVTSSYALAQNLISLRPLMAEIEDHDPAIQVWIIDACRENPYAAQGRGFATQGGLAKLPDQTNSFVFFAANYGQVARDSLPNDPPGQHLGSPFSRTFAALFDQGKNADIDEFARRVRQQVVKLVAPDPQFPMFENGILDQWCFADCNGPPAEIAPLAEARESAAPSTEPDPEPNVNLHLAASPRPPNTPLATHRAVFLGRESWADCDPAAPSAKFPFGCALLRRLVANRLNQGHVAPADRVQGKTFPILAPLPIYRSGPRPGPTGTILDCKLETLSPGASLHLQGIFRLRYGNDIFYWATVPGQQRPCPSDSPGSQP
jgi:hypothetical protein